MVRQRNDLAAVADISYDIIPSRYCLSRGISVPFWECRVEGPTICNGAKVRFHNIVAQPTSLPCSQKRTLPRDLY